MIPCHCWFNYVNKKPLGCNTIDDNVSITFSRFLCSENFRPTCFGGTTLRQRRQFSILSNPKSLTFQLMLLKSHMVNTRFAVELCHIICVIVLSYTFRSFSFLNDSGLKDKDRFSYSHFIFPLIIVLQKFLKMIDSLIQ